MKKIFLMTSALVLTACNSAAADTASTLYADNCASCHGSNTQTGSAPSLFDEVWLYGGEDAVIRHHIKNGIEDAGMPAFGDLLSDQDLKNMLEYLKSDGPVIAEPNTPSTPMLTQAVIDIPSFADQIISNDYITGLDEPWGMVFTSPTSLLVTEKNGKFLKVSPNSEPIVIRNIPAVNNGGQGGLLDVAIDPDYKTNKWVYLTFSHPLSGDSGPSMTKLIRGRIANNVWTDEETLFQAKPEDYLDTKYHYGSRITFDDKGHIFFSIGDRGKKDMAQQTDVPNGKIHRLNRDGSIPADNPFATGKYPSIYSYGNRNPQGLIWHKDSGLLWETEHGPKGGDELNVIKPGANYGWPEISYGINYNGTELTPFKSKPGMEQPASHWTPSIAVCGLDVYEGDLFPEWKGRLLAGSLAYKSLRLIEISGGQYVGEVELLKDAGRIRDVTTGPDGAIYVALPSKIVRLSPRQTGDSGE